MTHRKQEFAQKLARGSGTGPHYTRGWDELVDKAAQETCDGAVLYGPYG